MFAPISILLIIVAAIALAAIYNFVDSLLFATVLQLVLLAAVVGFFRWL
jgi:hypothetical protein